jgi:glycosyltransferase involved in cell wall biosynthesis
MLIGIDATTWASWRGFGRFVRSLVPALVALDRQNEYVLFFDRSFADCSNVPPQARAVVVPTRDVQVDSLAPIARRSIGDLRRMSLAVARERVDLFFCPSIDSYFPLVRPARTVVAIHDTIPETYPRMMLPHAASRARRRLKVRIALWQADRIVTGSSYARRQIARVFGLASDRIGIIPYGVSEAFRPPRSRERVRETVRAEHGIETPYFLHVGGVGPNKNIPMLLEAFADLRRDAALPATRLVFVGKREDDAAYPESRLVDELLARPELRDTVRFLGLQSDEALVRLYQAAEALVLPSLVEGFGLPAIESVACGTPAVVTSESPLGELLGTAALVVDPRSRGSLVAALRTMAGERPSTAARGAAETDPGRFSWDHSARAALEIFRQEAPESRYNRGTSPL